MHGTASASPPAISLLHDWFAATVERCPDAVALDIPPSLDRPARQRLTYRELDQLADALGARLTARASDLACGNATDHAEPIVAILLPRTTPSAYAAQLATLRAGAAYTCIDAAQPDERLRAILDDALAVALVTDAAGARRVRALESWRGVVIDAGATGAASSPDGPHQSFATPGSLAYVIYTSGTTGGPKGVMIEHRAIANLVASDIAEFGLRPGQRVGQSSSHAYDSSIEEIWLAFASGATVVVVDDDAVRMGPDLVAWLRDEQVNVFCPPPTLLRAMGCAEPKAALPALSLLYVGGEALPPEVADAWSDGRRMVNGYGPTESSVTALRADVRPGEPVTIGRPVPGVLAWVVDPDTLAELSNGTPGELCLGGAGLARGYWRHPQLTAEKFVDHPSIGRVYRTGDLVRQDAAGTFHYLGRIDAQVKIRGHRVELGEIESCLASFPGVRAAACRLQGEGPRQVLAAFVVPADPEALPSRGELTAHVRRLLPSHMVPASVAFIDLLPTNLAGKLDRGKLPGGPAPTHHAPATEPEFVDDVEAFVAATVRDVLGLPALPGPDDHFFTDLGGESLAAARLVTTLRDDGRTSSLAVRDVYEAPSVAGLAALARARRVTAPPVAATHAKAPESGRGTAALLQFAWLLLGGGFGGLVAYLVATWLLLPAVARLGLATFTLVAPLVVSAVLAVYTPLALGVAVLTKRVLIGRYREGQWPVWGSFYVRHWVVLRTLRLVPWRLVEGTEFQLMALRALGARIGRRVHVHRGVDLLHGGWDLLEIGDDASILQDASLQLAHLEHGELVVGPVTLASEVTLDVHASVSPGCHLGRGAYLTAWSWMPPGTSAGAGERWEGIPARHVDEAPPPPRVTHASASLTPGLYSLAFAIARAAAGLVIALAMAATLGLAVRVAGIDERALISSLTSPDWHARPFLSISTLAVLVVPVWLVLLALMVRVIAPPPDRVISRWSVTYLRVWLSTGMLRAAGEWLSGAIFWPHWLRLAGMRVGRGCEISTIIDVVASHVSIGQESFFADGIYLACPRVHRGTVSLAGTRVGAGTFLGNHVIIPAGQQLPDDVLLGVCTVANDSIVRPGSSWFGHPPFELPRRERVEEDRSLTHDPSWLRYVNRWLWEAARVGLPVVPACIGVAWLKALSAADAAVGPLAFALVAAPIVSLSAAVTLCAIVLALKWLLLGRVRPGRHALWSCWCSRWDFLYMAWGFWARRVLSAFEGTPMLPWYVRAMGSQVGRGAVLGSGFAQVVDPDMLHIEDGATVDCLFQAHTFEDRVLKIDHVFIRRDATLSSGSVVLYGADIGAEAHVASHSVVMKRERLLPGRSYVGCPTRIFEGA